VAGSSMSWYPVPGDGNAGGTPRLEFEEAIPGRRVEEYLKDGISLDRAEEAAAWIGLRLR
jgi:hypothetical protein